MIGSCMREVLIPTEPANQTHLAEAAKIPPEGTRVFRPLNRQKRAVYFDCLHHIILTGRCATARRRSDRIGVTRSLRVQRSWASHRGGYAAGT